MKNCNIIIEPDDYCFGDPWGETRCTNLNKEDMCEDIEECYECKNGRIKEILNSIKIKGEKE